MSDPTKARSLELFFIDGKPDGMLTAQVFNWTGHVLVTPRTRMKEALSRPESQFTGVYLLVGEEDDEQVLYVGEGENIANRIKNHDANKDWWSTCILVTSQANNLHKAHVQYLESRLVQKASDTGLARLENGTQPKPPTLSEASEADMESFLEYLLMVLPAVRVDVFLKKTRPSINRQEVRDTAFETVFEISLKKEKLTGTAILIDGEFVVQAGSKARKEWIGKKSNAPYKRLYESLISQGVLEDMGDHKRFTVNYAFKSTSAAGAVIKGRATAGPVAWTVKGTRKTYKEWEAENLEDL